MSWDPSQYLKFSGHRLRPAVDLLARIAAESPRLVCDLGCGAGNVTRLLRGRWPNARIVGIDNSSEMLARAAAEAPDVDWVNADLAGWRPDAPPDVIFSNAALHWLDRHRPLFAALFAALAPGGTLAVQMPRNHSQPSHREMVDCARSGPWRDVLEPLLREEPVLRSGAYWDILAQAGAAPEAIDIWETDYLHALSGKDAVLEWVKGTALRPLLDALQEPWRSQFFDDYRRRVAAAYPQGPDGITLFPFRRLFIVARRA